MSEQVGRALDFMCFYVASKKGKTGLTVTATVRNRTGTVLANAQAATEVGGGLYRYTLAAGSNTGEDMLTCVFTTADTSVDQQDVPTLWAVGKGGIQNLDSAVSAVGTPFYPNALQRVR